MTAVLAESVEIDENLEHVRAQLLSDVADAVRSLERAAGHAEALRVVDQKFHGRDGRYVGTLIDDAIRSARAGYAVAHLIVERA